jgi:hypothetical protein
MKFKSFQTILMFMLGVTSLSTFLLVFKTPSEEWPMWSDDGEAAPIVADEGVRLRTVKPVAAPPLETLAQVQTINTSSISKPTLYVLTTGVRHFQAPQAFTTTTVMGQVQTATVGPTFDEGYGPQEWPEGAKRVVDGMVTIWMKIAAECSGWCFVSEDDAIWPNGIPSELPSDGFVSFFKEAVCAQATGAYSENYDSVVKAVIPGKCMPYGAVAYAITGNFAKMLLSNLPMSKPVDHFLWEQAVVQKKAYVSRRYVVRHKKGKSLRQNTVKHPPPNADNPVPMLHNNSGYILYKDVDQLGSDIGKPVEGIGVKPLQTIPFVHHIGVKSSKSRPKIAVAIPTYNRAGTPLHTTLNRTTIDVVIPWVNYSSGYHENEKVPFDFGEPLFNIVSTVGLKRPPWSEICWTVRSILFYGSQYIRNVYIVYNSYRHAAPDCHFGDNVISMPQQVFLKGTILEGLSSPKPHAVFPFFHRIKSLSDYFLFSMDDIFLLKPFDLDTFYDSNSQQILTHMTGGIRGISAGSYESNMALERIFGRPGQFSDGLHVPFLVKKKSQEDMMHSLPFLFSKCSEPKYLCDFGIQYQTLIQNYMVLSGTARNSAATIGFSEIHTDEQTNLKQALHVSATWLNVQGTGVSDEYGGTKSARIRLRTVFDSWLIKQPFYHVSKPSPKIAVAIPTYNRAGYVQLCAAALNKTIDPNDVWIFDDHSTEYTAGDLQKWFGSHSVQRNAKRFKADKQARHILEWFVGTDYDWLITLDSDLIVRPDWLELLRGMLPHTQGVMSLYHSGNPNHPTLHCDPNLCEMKSLGNAGVAWSKVLAKKMLVDMTQSDGFDWGWTEWLRKQKIPQYAAKDSLVLHVGMHGTWGADSKREKSVGFPMDKLSPDVRGRAELFLKGMQ